ncbi:non-hydrolyzing UDP-N-acetylglucosamine 2-epimerase [Limosilactobacillus albertensis]|uniref:UDP-N-acetylglucosamine 2-epimerase (non-hydrolyzing) n=1 Tax=Limosilactobacillus albertensis TaxID=2759752 RepID=A0A839H442_9LACO|nr:UDP-N-acetylglucosamine 2-epimerase (non-hydrolyzing) [Limosilactobacillus albertensis]MBB1124544.1 UDP-N-acetylglucosamine 2-epimerase (non-hydrolyzing) [Limosilactobacillus albertensis]MCD7123078.1 UDP-N-acetylglucosamine 2-epimerase (non-hydrolyzing) [Limosilactobacillus albertensis]
MKKIKIMTVFGTRPEAIKMAPLILEAKKRNNEFEVITTVTGQHKEMLDQVLDIFNITPDYNLKIMHSKQTLTDITINILAKLDKILNMEKPDIILVHGDTTSTLAASISSFYHKIAVGHVEAGLRTWKKYSPFPEEMNRQMTDVLSDLYFAPTQLSKDNLLKESHNEKSIFVTGNTAIDALKNTVNENYHHSVLDKVKKDNKLILVTMHRRENLGKPMENVFNAIKEMVLSNSNIEIVYPVHLNPVVQDTANRILGHTERIHLIDPLDVVDFHNLIARSYFVMTDSGGVQEEAPSLGKPVLVLRDATERPEGVKAGTLMIAGTEKNHVKNLMNNLLHDHTLYQKMSKASNPYGDGLASKRILDDIRYYFTKEGKISEFKG